MIIVIFLLGISASEAHFHSRLKKVQNHTKPCSDAWHMHYKSQ